VYLKARLVGLIYHIQSLINATAVSDCQTPSGQIPDEPEQGIDDYGTKDYEKRGFET